MTFIEERKKKWLREIILTPQKDPLFICFVKKFEFCKDFKVYFIGKNSFKKIRKESRNEIYT